MTTEDTTAEPVFRPRVARPLPPSLRAAIDVRWWGIAAQRAASVQGDIDVGARSYGALRGVLAGLQGAAHHAFAMACWCLTQGAILDTRPDDGCVLVHLTGTYIGAAAGLPPADSYPARRALWSALGAEVVWGEPGANGHRPQHMWIRLEARAAAGTLASQLTCSGELAEPLVRTGPGPTPIPLVAIVVNGRARVRCPGHDDQTPSLSVVVHPDGTGGAKCHASTCGRRYAVRTDGGRLVLLEAGTTRDVARGTAREAGETIHDPPQKGASWEASIQPPIQRSVRPDRIGMTLHPDGKGGMRPRFGVRGGSQTTEIGVRFMTDKARIKAEQTRDQRYESVGWKVPSPQNWRRCKRSGRLWASGYSTAAGTDRVISDLDRLTPGTGPDGSDPGLPAVLERFREIVASSDGWLLAVDMVETSSDGVQIRFWLTEPVDAEGEEELYADPDREARILHLTEIAQTLIGRGGVIDRSVWRPGGFCRVPGWRWSERTKSMFRARLVDEEERMRGYDAAIAEFREARKARRAAGEPTRRPSPKPKPTPSPVVGLGPDPHPASIAEAIVADIGGRAWIDGPDERWMRIYFGDEWADPIWPDKSGTVIRGKIRVSSGLPQALTDRIAKAANDIGPRVRISAEEASALVDRLANALGGIAWHKHGLNRVYWGRGDKERWIQVQAPSGLAVTGRDLDEFTVRRVHALLRDWRKARVDYHPAGPEVADRPRVTVVRARATPLPAAG